ncbi:MAG: hypothetical protein ABI389_07910 [Rhodanobacter sp.]
MSFRVSLIFCAMLLAGTAAAQIGMPSQTAQNDRWEAVPAAASSSSYPAERLLPSAAGTANSPFHFKQTAQRGPAHNPPPQANDKAAVMGQQRPWQNGRPPVDCALEPRDPACR